jgi:hypothetical protein
MTPEEIVVKLTGAIEVSDKASIYNPSHDKENPDLATALNMIDNIIVDILLDLDPDWQRP